MWHQVEDINHNAIHLFVDDTIPDHFKLEDFNKYKSMIVVIPYQNSGAINLFQEKFRLLCADQDNICLVRSEAEVPTPSTATREAFVLIWDKTHTHILVEVPSDNKNILHLPGGHVHHYERSQSAAIREVQEEIGLDVAKYGLKQLVVIEYQNPEKIKPFDQFQILFFYEVQSDLDLHSTKVMAQSSEVSDVYWARIQDLKEHQLSAPLRLILQDSFENYH